MEVLYLDVINSDWHDWRGTGKDEDRLLKPGWVEQLVARWGLPITSTPDSDTIAALQSLRALMQTILQKQVPSEQEIIALNSYLDAAPSRLHMMKAGEHYALQQVPLYNDWRWVLREIAASFATLFVEYDPTRIKQCENPDCRWLYYDESANQTRRWCEDGCANLIRVRRFRARQKNRRNA